MIDRPLLDARFGLTALARAANRNPAKDHTARQQLERILTTRLSRLLDDTIAVGRETGGVIGEVLADVMARSGDPAKADHVLDRVPESSLALKPVLLAAATVRLRALPAVTADLDDETRLEVGRISFNAANIELGMGLAQEAMKHLGDAIKAFSPLAQERPGLWMILGGCLTAAALAFKNLDDHRQALDAARNGVELMEIATKQNPDDPLVSDFLATALMRLSDCAERLGHRSEALEAIDRAVGLLEELAEREPGDHEPDLSLALNVQSLRRAQVEQFDAALSSARRAVSLVRRLANDDPDRFGDYLANALSTYALRCMNVGRLEDALPSVEEALAFYRKYFPILPATMEFPLANVLYTHALVLEEGDDLAGAEGAAAEAVRRFDALSRKFYLPEQGMAWRAYGTILLRQGRDGEAHAAFATARQRYAEANAALGEAYVEELKEVEDWLEDRRPSPPQPSSRGLARPM